MACGASSRLLYRSVAVAFFSLYHLGAQDSTETVVYHLPQIADGRFSGGILKTSFVLFNPGQDSVSLTLSLARDDGTPLVVQIPEFGTGSEFKVALEPRGSRILQTSGAGNLAAGAASVRASRQIGTSAIFTLYDGDGNFVTEAGVAASPEVADFVIPVDTTGAFDTGLAVQNFGSDVIEFHLALSNETGNIVGSKWETLPARAHLARFVTEFFPQAPKLRGKLVVSSARAMTALALRQNSAPLSYTTLPVVPADSTATRFELPQVADGGGIRTTFVLYNLTRQPAKLTLSLTQQNGAPLSVSIPGLGLNSIFNLELGPGACHFLQTDGSNPVTVSGAATVTSSTPLGVSAIISLVDVQGDPVAETGVGASPLVREFTLPVDNAGPGSTGLALFNSSSESVTLKLELRNSNGTLRDTLPTYSLPPGGHLAKFVWELFPGTESFRGSLSVSASGAVSALTVRQNASPVAFTTLPIASSAESAVVILEDSVGDWRYPSLWMPSWGFQPPEGLRATPLPVSFIDLRSVTFRMAGDSLIIRYQVAGALPRTKNDFPNVLGERISSFSFWVAINADNNWDTGYEEWGAERWLVNGWSVLGDGSLHQELAYMLEARIPGRSQPSFYGKRNAQLLSGGPGYDYLEVAYSLPELGLVPGQTVTFAVSARAANEKERTVSGDILENNKSFGRGQTSFALKLGSGLVPHPAPITVPRPPGIRSLPSCGERTEFFTALMFPLADMTWAIPLGGIGDAGHTLPMFEHGFGLRTDYTQNGWPVAVEVPVVSPGDMRLLAIDQYEVEEGWEGGTSKSLYAMWFAACRELVIFSSLAVSLAPRLLESFLPPYDFSMESVSGLSFFRDRLKAVDIPVQAGELLGTWGGLRGYPVVEIAAWDYRTPPLPYANAARWPVAHRHAVCSLDYFTPEPGTQLRSRIGGPMGMRTAAPLCGTIALDEPGTAQGVWFRPGVETLYEDMHLSLLPHSVNPALKLIVIATGLQQSSGIPVSPPGGYLFDPLPSGRVNRDFKDVTADGLIYCYEVFRNWYTGEKLPSTILLQMTSPTTIRIEGRQSAQCGAGPWQFGTTYTDFER